MIAGEIDAPSPQSRRCEIWNLPLNRCSHPLLYVKFSAIHQKNSLNPIDKFNYLKSHLGETALNTVEGFALSADNYEKAIKLLKDRFGREDILISRHMNNLLSMRPLKTSSDVRTFREIFDNLSVQIRSLESLNVSIDVYGQLLCPIIIELLPADLNLELNKELTTGHVINDLITFLERKLTAQEKSFRNEIDNHGSPKCDFSANLSLNEKRSLMRKKGVCYKCLRPSHLSKFCRNVVHCSICNMSSHLDVMCTKRILDRGGSSKSPTVQDETLANLLTSPDVLLPTLRVTLKGNRTEKMARAIIDTGSQRSYILHSTAMEMEYEQSSREFFRHSLFGGSSTDVVEHEVYTIHLSDINNSYRCEFEALGQPLICGSIPPVCPRSFLEGSEELNVSDLMRDRIEVLIGAEIAGRLLTDDQRRISSGLVAIRTKLGWTVMGKIPPTEVRDDTSSLCVTTLLSLDLENLWKLDAIGVSGAEVEKKTQSLQAEMEKHFAHTTTRDIEGRYEVALPWVQDKERIPTNRDLAENQLSSVRRKLVEVGDMKEYEQIFEEWMNQGIIDFQNVVEMEKFVKESTELLSTACFNLRDWVSKVTDFSFMNLLNKEVNILGITRITDRDALTIGLEDFELIGQTTKRKVLSIASKIFDPLGVACPVTLIPKLILQETWTQKLTWDEVLPGCLGGLAPKTNIDQEDLLSQENIDKIHDLVMLDRRMTVHQIEETLGNPKNNSGSDHERTLGPQEVFCPLGSQTFVTMDETWAHHFTPESKQQSMQWRNSGSPPPKKAKAVPSAGKVMVSVFWDSEGVLLLDFLNKGQTITGHYYATLVKRLREAIRKREEESRPGRLFTIKTMLRVIGRCKPWLLFMILALNLYHTCTLFTRSSSTYGTPLVIGARLAANVIQDLEFKEIPRFYWTDSTNALCWIQKEDNWAAFVMNHVKEIHNLSSPESWRHIPGRLNPADLPSWGCSAERLKETRWWEGPAWLKVSQEEWPKSTIIPDLEIVYSERRKTILNTLCTTRENENLFGLGVDLTGHLILKNKKKTWIVIFTCAVYRGVHLEHVTSLSMETFLQASRRFIARRGRPLIVYSDNETNFRGTANTLKKIDFSRLKCDPTLKNITWKFIPPGTPWWGGWWERLIGMMKQLLFRILGQTSLRYEKLSTVMCDFESLMNTRPLNYLTEESEDLVPLTSSLFLYEVRKVGVPDLDLIDNQTLSRKYQYIKRVREDLRERFRIEYFGFLRQETRRLKTTIPFKVGDMVLIGQGSLKRLHWPLARIIQLYPGKDGFVRVAKVKTSSGDQIQPIQKLYNLEITPEIRCRDPLTERSPTQEVRLNLKRTL
ncbi:hypothetical protein LAZ67_21001503 [Cordylochernes scorpioides]|uniref:Integrase catalytic domain-containing protein n=1 Tax=Cordylochernes scorpioides TaxID=51811 RepID=A0ABY6LMC9_9ARAC|nr:hypothetical protein LAZ67_21001503 [Cordylochernes scorpioides]